VINPFANVSSVSRRS